MKAEDLPERDLAKRPAWYRAVSRERTRATRLLGVHQSTDEGKVPRHRSSPVKGIALEQKGRQRDGALYLCAVRGELNGIIQARRRRVGREGEVDGACDQPAFGGCRSIKPTHARFKRPSAAERRGCFII